MHLRLSAFCWVFVIFLSLEGSQSQRRKGPTNREKICSSPECIEASWRIGRNLNTSVDPCDNFYQFACGGWKKVNHIPSYLASWSIFHTMMESVWTKLLHIFQSQEMIANPTLAMVYDWYQSCIDEKKRDEVGAKPLIQVIEKIGSWPLIDESFNESAWTLMESMINVHMELGFPTVFAMLVSSDNANSSINILQFDQTSLSLGARDFYLSNETYVVKLRKRYKKLVIKVVTLLRQAKGKKATDKNSIKQLKRDVDDLVDFETELAKRMKTVVQSRKAEDNYFKTTIRNMNNLCPNFDWLFFIQSLYKTINPSAISEDSEIVVHALDYLVNMTALLKNTPKKVLANFIGWNVAYTLSQHLSSEFDKIHYRFQRYKDGSRARVPRDKMCITSTDYAMDMAVGLLYVNKYFNNMTTVMAHEMIQNVREVLIDDLEKVEWMDTETKEAAKEKAKNIVENIAYPKFIMNMTALSEYFNGLTIKPDSYFQNFLSHKKNKRIQNLKELFKPVDRKTWSMSPCTINAYYSPQSNKIVIPAGILQSPFFDPKYPEFINYGGMGMILGHELVHGFDDEGRRFNKIGNMAKWWTNDSVKNFEKRAQCFVDQYDSYRLLDHPVNGKLTLGENIADAVGLKIAYEAYLRYIRKHNVEKFLPAFNYGPEEIFFISFAQIWCKNTRPKYARNDLRVNSHSPSEYRVIGALSNLKEFSDVFKCPVGSLMNPKKKCTIW